MNNNKGYLIIFHLFAIFLFFYSTHISIYSSFVRSIHFIASFFLSKSEQVQISNNITNYTTQFE